MRYPGIMNCGQSANAPGTPKHVSGQVSSSTLTRLTWSRGTPRVCESDCLAASTAPSAVCVRDWPSSPAINVPNCKFGSLVGSTNSRVGAGVGGLTCTSPDGGGACVAGILVWVTRIVGRETWFFG